METNKYYFVVTDEGCMNGICEKVNAILEIFVREDFLKLLFENDPDSNYYTHVDCRKFNVMYDENSFFKRWEQNYHSQFYSYGRDEIKNNMFKTFEEAKAELDKRLKR